MWAAEEVLMVYDDEFLCGSLRFGELPFYLQQLLVERLQFTHVLHKICKPSIPVPMLSDQVYGHMWHGFQRIY